MEYKEIHRILQHKRKSDVWVCPNCDCENSMSSEICSMCRGAKPQNAYILRQWTPADDIPVAPPPKPPVKRKAPISSGPVFIDRDRDSYTEPKKKFGPVKALAIIFIIILVVIVAFFALNEFSNVSKYNHAVEQYNQGYYAQALLEFKELPDGYKDVSYMLNETNYQMAYQRMEAGDYVGAEAQFDSIYGYSDSSSMVYECKYRSAKKMMEEGQYESAKNIFAKISSHSDSRDMLKECDYLDALRKKNNGMYVQAMKIFKGLETYSDSAKQFTNTEDLLIYKNESYGYFYNPEAMEGNWRDTEGNYIDFDMNDSGVTTSCNIVDYERYYNVEYGVLMTGYEDYNMKKIGIFQRVSSDTAYFYDYKDNRIYYLTR